jgi:hypothetical protein
MLGLEGAEQRFLSTEDLHCGGWVLGERHERSGVSDESGSYELTDHDGQVRSDRVHAIAEILEQRSAIFANGDDLITERFDVFYVFWCDFSSHGDFSGLFELRFDLFAEHLTQVNRMSARADTEQTNNLNKQSRMNDSDIENVSVLIWLSVLSRLILDCSAVKAPISGQS